MLTIYFGASPFGYAAFALLLLFPVRDREKRARLFQSIMRNAFALMHYVLSIARILEYNRKLLPPHIPHSPCVIVANHPTLTDFSAIYASIPKVSSVIKPIVYSRFWAYPLLAQAAQFKGASADPVSIARMIDDAVDRLARGYHVLIFPEGTRSPPTGLRPFGRSAFEIAVRAGVPVLPCVIRCSPVWLTKERSFFNPPVRMPRLSIEALAPIDPKDTGASSRELREQVHRAIEGSLTSTE